MDQGRRSDLFGEELIGNESKRSIFIRKMAHSLSLMISIKIKKVLYVSKLIGFDGL
jgi:hypothetical protein